MAENENIALQRRIFENEGLSASEKLVALCLVWHRNTRTGQCNPGQAAIARETGLKERAVRSALHGLGAKGIIRATRTQKTTRYEFFGPSGSLNGLPASGAGLERHLMPVGTRLLPNHEPRGLADFKDEQEAGRHPMRRRRARA
ncbi:MAG: helix-turn-helix domain-containing protein [Desulfovibrio sp.]